MHVAVLSIAPWESYVEVLQPRFEIDEAGALAAVMPTTASTTMQSRDSKKTKFELGKSISATPPPAPTTPQSTAGKPSVPDAPFTATTLTSDPMSRYWAATSLYQEVQMLSRYIEDAAIKRDLQAYVIRFQISLMPRARREPYDVYTTISFFSSDPNAHVPTTPERGIDEPGGSDATESSSAAPAPVVIPLLVSDNLEASLSARGDETVRGFGFNVGYGIGPQSASLGHERERSDVERGAGRDLNGLLTLAQVTPNTLRIRLGAMQQGTTEWAMVPRTHNITVVVAVPPDGPRGLRMGARTVMVDAKTGVELPGRSPARITELYEDVAKRHKLGDGGADLLRRLLPLAQQNRQAEFFALLKRERPNQRYPDALWLEVASIIVGGQYNAAVIELPPRPPKPVLPKPQAVLVFDNGQTCIASVHGGTGISLPHLDAFLVVRDGDRELRFPALGFEPGPAALRIGFPSLLALGLKADGIYLELDHGRAADGSPLRAEYEEVVYRAAPAAPKQPAPAAK